MMARSTSPDKQGNLGEPSNNSINDNIADFNVSDILINMYLGLTSDEYEEIVDVTKKYLQ